MAGRKYRKPAVLAAVFAFLFAACLYAAGTSVCQKFAASKVKGSGPLPYNYRIIDGNIHAGGHPLNPSNNFGNTDGQAAKILDYLKSRGVAVVIDLENTKRIKERYKRLLADAGIKRLHVPMNASKTPSAAEWKRMKEAMKEPVYIHCKWGADRTGAVIAKYLVDVKGYSPEEAYKAVITGGSHAGALGGLKKTYYYTKLLDFFWPDRPLTLAP